jgi:NAD(P)-dependent dehydrogenase (short-subunit alcohol dehydrogenase family)
VTGSSSGNGRAIALAFAREGAAVLCADLTKSARPEGYEPDVALDTDDLIMRGGGSAEFVATDMRRSTDVRAAVERAATKFGRLDIMVNNAGVITGLQTIVEESEEQYDFTMDVNAKGVWLGCKFAITQMLKQESPNEGSRGRVINVASIAGLVGIAAEPAYCASKGAVASLTRQLALDFAPQRINVNAICPGFLVTAMVRPFLQSKTINRKLHETTPWPRIGSPDDVAKCAVFLASDDSEWVTGSMIVVDGGYTAG